jgi:hypothetical protein
VRIFSRLAISFVSGVSLALAACGGPPASKPGQGKPAPRLPMPDLNARPGKEIWSQLRQFSDYPKACRAATQDARGLDVTPLPDKINSPGCGYRNAVRLDKTLIPISRTVDVSCPMAAGLHLWMREVVQPAARLHLDAKVVRIVTFGTYACRSRNNQAGKRLSEHATANAMDVSGFMLDDGRTISVEKGWRGAADSSAFLRAVHKQSCTYFSVVIGPDGDKYHYNHLHMDMGKWKLCK